MNNENRLSKRGNKFVPQWHFLRSFFLKQKGGNKVFSPLRYENDLFINFNF